MSHETFRTIGVVVGTHGLHGALKVNPLSDFPERFSGLDSVFLIRGEEPPSLERIAHFRWAGAHLLMVLDGVQSREAALELRGAELCVRDEDSWKLPPDVFFATDLLGFVAVDQQGHSIGVLKDVLRGAQDILEIEREGRELLVPFVHQWVGRVSVADRTIEILNWRDLFAAEEIKPDSDSDDD